MRIKQISVKKLFGSFDHTIPLHMDEGMTIIHALNGNGKTTLLRLINDLFNGPISVLRTIPFQEFRVELEDGSALWVTKKASSVDMTQSEKADTVTFHYTSFTGEQKKYDLPLPTKQESLSMPYERFIPELERVGSDRWFHPPTGEILSETDVLVQFGDILPYGLFTIKMPEWLQSVRSSVNIQLIETQRLINFTSVKARRSADYTASSLAGKSLSYEFTVVKDAHDLVHAIRKKLTESAALSQSLDQTFPARVVNDRTQQHLTEDDLRLQLAALEEKRKQLMSVGLLDQSNADALLGYQNIDESKRAVLAVYLKDAHDKLTIYDDIYAKIHALKTIIDKRFINKKMIIDKEQGFVFQTTEGTLLSPTSLSSGEQHELVLFYELLFRVPAGSLILIDEPEISLHVVWQQEFLKDLQEVVRLTKLDMLIATHSPQIINDRWDLTVELKGTPSATISHRR